MGLIRISLAYFLEILTWVIVVRSLLSWVPALFDSKLYEILTYITEPIEAPIRIQLNRIMDGPLDFSPIVAIILLSFFKGILL